MSRREISIERRKKKKKKIETEEKKESEREGEMVVMWVCWTSIIEVILFLIIFDLMYLLEICSTVYMVLLLSPKS